MKLLARTGIVLLSHLVINIAAAQPVSYSFSTGFFSSCCVPDLAAVLAGSSVSGSFVYDASAQQTFTTNNVNFSNASGYGPYLAEGVPTSSYTSLAATLSGGGLGSTVFSFSDPRGSTLVSNEGFASPPGSALGDYLGLDADPFGPAGTHNIQPFMVGGYTLWNMRLFWTEFSAQGDVVPNQNLPGALPSGFARLALDFVPAGSTSGTPLSFAFYDNVAVTPAAPIPEPETYAMLLAGLGLMAFVARRRKQQEEA